MEIFQNIENSFVNEFELIDKICLDLGGLLNRGYYLAILPQNVFYIDPKDPDFKMVPAQNGKTIAEPTAIDLPARQGNRASHSHL